MGPGSCRKSRMDVQNVISHIGRVMGSMCLGGSRKPLKKQKENQVNTQVL